MNRSLFKLTFFFISSLFFLSILAFPGPPVWRNLVPSVIPRPATAYSAELNTWSTIGPWGGSISALIIDPQNPSRIYVGTPRGVFTSIDSGQSWIESNNGMTGGSVWTMAIDPQNSTTLYCGSFRVFKSTDGGRNWKESGNFEASVIISLVVHPLQTNLVYASTILYMGKDGPKFSLFRSDDGGDTWAEKYGNGGEVVLDPNDPNVVYQTCGLKSNDGGTTWTSLDLGVTFSVGGIRSMVIDPVNSATIYAGTGAAGIYKSMDGGTTWSSKNFGLGSLQIREISVDPQNPAVLYTGTDDRGIFKSNDAGDTWIAANSGLETARVEVVTVDPIDGNRVFAGTILGVFKSSNGGLSWNVSNSGFSSFDVKALAVDPGRRGTIYATVGGFYDQSFLLKTIDGGAAWTVLMSSLFRSTIDVIVIDPNDSQTLYAGTYDGVYKSVDAGATWIRVGLANLWINAIEIDPRNSSTIYAGTEQGVFKSLDAGETWASLTAGLSVQYTDDLKIDPNNTATVYAAGYKHLLKTTDAGTSWKEIGPGSENSFTSVAIDPRNSNIIYAVGGGSRVLKSEDAGQTWTPINNGLPQGNMRKLVINPLHSSTLYATNWGGSIYKSTNSGLSWAIVNDGLRDLYFSNIAFDPSDSATLYAASSMGIFRITFGDCRVIFEGSTGGQLSGSLDQIIPQGGKTSPVSAVPDPGYSLVWTGPGGFTSTANPLILDPVFQNMTILAHFTTQPILALSKTKLTFGRAQGQVTGSQRVFLTNRGGGTLDWSAVSSTGGSWSWIWVSPSAGTGNGAIDIITADISAGTWLGTVSVTASGAFNSPQTISVVLNVVEGNGQSPFGSLDTPIEDSKVSSSIAVTGWALDDIEVVEVKIYRDPVGSEPTQPNGLVYIGDAFFVEGARPDVEKAYPDYPLNDRAGWGYMLLTNFLPDGGNGTFTLHAIVIDKGGNQVSLGQKTITCDNRNAVKPFGAIDTPTQGGTVSGSSFINFGWALTPLPKSIPIDGSTITVWVDGLPLGHPTYNNFRPDIASLFPGYANSNGAVGYYYLDTTGYLNGVHTIAWSVEDSQGALDGIGSRYFQILNTGNGSTVGGTETTISDVAGGMDANIYSAAEGLKTTISKTGAGKEATISAAAGYGKDTASLARAGNRRLSANLPSTSGDRSIAEIQNLYSDMTSPIHVRRGYTFDRPADPVYPNREGSLSVSIAELERVAIYLDTTQAWETREELEARGRELRGTNISPYPSSVPAVNLRYSAFLLVGSELRPLPIGATFDAERGVLYWQPGPGFLGDFDFVFVDGNRNTKKAVKIRIGKELDWKTAL